MPNAEVDVEYALYYKQSGTFHPVTSPADLAIQDGFLAADSDPRVESVDDVGAQDEILDAHCQATFDNVSVSGHTIAFATIGYTIWIDATKSWEMVAVGGAIHYAVVGPTSSSTDPRLYWQARTQGAGT